MLRSKQTSGVGVHQYPQMRRRELHRNSPATAARSLVQLAAIESIGSRHREIANIDLQGRKLLAERIAGKSLRDEIEKAQAEISFPFRPCSEIQSFGGPHLHFDHLIAGFDPGVPFSIIEERRAKVALGLDSFASLGRRSN